MSLSAKVESALHRCGRERVMHREYGGAPAVAIRYDGEARITSPDGEQRFLVREGATLDEAGEAAARAFAARIRDESKRLADWADRIEGALNP